MRILGIDIGTSAVKVCLTDAAGAVRATAEAPLTSQHPFDGASEQNAEDWYAALKSALGALPEEDRTRIVAIGLSGQMHGAVMLDAADRPIRPVILWNDGRAQAECGTMAAAEPEIGDIGGIGPLPGFTAPKILWLKAHAPEDHTRIRSVILPKDYIGLRLHGRRVTDPSDAAGTLWLDQRTRGWSQRLCALSATDPAWLPEIVNGCAVAGHVLGSAAADLGIPQGIPVAAGAGDAAAGAVGIGAVEDGDGFLSLGTSGQLFVTTGTYRPNPAHRVHAYAHTVPGRWFQMAAMLNGARPLAWFADLVNLPLAQLISEAEKAAPGPLFLPYLSGERTPHGDAGIRAGFWGLSETTGPATLMRAVVESVAFTFADAADALRAGGTEPADLFAIGGGTRSDFVLQTIADVLGVRIGRSDGAQVGPALGAARLAMVAVGHGTLAQVARKPAVSDWFEPNAAAGERLAARLAGYRALYPAMKTVSAAMTQPRTE